MKNPGIKADVAQQVVETSEQCIPVAFTGAPLRMWRCWLHARDVHMHKAREGWDMPAVFEASLREADMASLGVNTPATCTQHVTIQQASCVGWA